VGCQGDSAQDLPCRSCRQCTTTLVTSSQRIQVGNATLVVSSQGDLAEDSPCMSCGSTVPGSTLSQHTLGLSWESSAQVNSCGIIPLSSIVRRVHIVPAFERGTAVVKSGSYHLNPFKY
jgi:hypothetical protein